MPKNKIPTPTYRLDVSHAGLDAELDARIERAVRRRPLGTGFDFTNGRRDLDFGFAGKDAALRAGKRARSIRGVRARVRKVGND